MIEGLKSDALIRKVGGAFRLTALIQRRLKELVEGSRPLVETKGKTMIEVVIQEIEEDKIAVDYEHSENLAQPDREELSKNLRTGTLGGDIGGALRHGDTGGMTT